MKHGPYPLYPIFVPSTGHLVSYDRTLAIKLKNQERDDSGECRRDAENDIRRAKPGVMRLGCLCVSNFKLYYRMTETYPSIDRKANLIKDFMNTS